MATGRGKKRISVNFEISDYEWLLDLMTKVSYVVDVNPKNFTNPVLGHIAGVAAALDQSKMRAAETDVDSEPHAVAPPDARRPGRSGNAQGDENSTSRRDKAITVIISFKRPFTVVQAANRSRTSLVTARSIIESQVEVGVLKEAGTDPRHIGRGRAPMRYHTSEKD